LDDLRVSRQRGATDENSVVAEAHSSQPIARPLGDEEFVPAGVTLEETPARPRAAILRRLRTLPADASVLLQRPSLIPASDAASVTERDDETVGATVAPVPEAEAPDGVVIDAEPLL